ncbi:thiamine phosphate synthase [Candidatus Omnitrophota bacterium]
MQDFRLYVIVDADICAGAGGNILKIARRVVSAGADLLQLRAKNATDRKILALGRKIKKITKDTATRLIINDRADLAKIIGADGVHLGQGDLPVKEARKILGKDQIIGLSTHGLKQAVAAEQQGADYIGLGPIFTTATKPGVRCLTPKIITQIKAKIKIPFVAIGGITLKNIGQITARGAQRVAVCRAIVEAKDVGKTAKAFKQRLNQSAKQ